MLGALGVVAGVRVPVAALDLDRVAQAAAQGLDGELDLGVEGAGQLEARRPRRGRARSRRAAGVEKSCRACLPLAAASSRSARSSTWARIRASSPSLGTSGSSRAPSAGKVSCGSRRVTIWLTEPVLADRGAVRAAVGGAAEDQVRGREVGGVRGGGDGGDVGGGVVEDAGLSDD